MRLREERRRADLRELSLRQKETELKAGVTGKLKDLLSESRKTLENLVREVREGELSREKTLKVKEFLNDLEKSVEAENAALEEEEKNLAGEMSRVLPSGPLRSADGVSAFAPGAGVRAGAYRRQGLIVRQDKKPAPGRSGEKSWIVEIGSLKMSFPESELELVPQSKARAAVTGAGWAADISSPSAAGELSVRGMRLEEALEALRRQIDAAVLSGLAAFSVIHGKGGGILMKGVHEYLAADPRVADHYFSRPELGGAGRTEVVLK
jgi:DNA mismatch repair protein MutS2